MTAPEGYRCAKPVVWLKAILYGVTLPPVKPDRRTCARTSRGHF